MERPTSFTDRLVTGTIFGAAFAYCIVGAIRGRLFIPHHRGYGNDVYLSGLAAWSLVTAVVLMWLGISVRLGLVERLTGRARTIVEFSFIVAGVALLLASGRLPTITAA
jgi:hypothetical protein